MKVTPVGAVSNYGVQMQQQPDKTKHPHYCIFEQKICRYAKRENGGFTCKAPSDEAMKCR